MYTEEKERCIQKVMRAAAGQTTTGMTGTEQRKQAATGEAGKTQTQ